MSTNRSGEKDVRGKRPWFLVVALVITWLMGMYGATSGWATVSYLRSGQMPDDGATLDEARGLATAGNGACTDWNAEPCRTVFVKSANPRSIAMTRERTLPLAIAQMLLSIILVAGSAFALAGRQSGKNLMFQALLANLLFAAVEFALTKQTRMLMLTEMRHAGEELSSISPDAPRAFATAATSMTWSPLIAKFFFLGMAMVGIHTRRARDFFATAREADQRRETDDEDDL